MQLPAPPSRLHVLTSLATVVLIVACLHFGREVLMPITFAVLLVLLLSPLVVRLTRWGLPKAVAIVVSVSLAFCVLGAIGWLIADQALRLGKELPNYEHNLREKISALRQPHTPPALAEVARMVEQLGQEIAAPPPADAARPAGAPAEPKPVPVEVRTTKHSPLVAARDIIMPMLPPLATAGIVIVFVIAMLFRREDLRDRFIQLVSAGRLNLATQAVDEAAERVSRYLRMQLLVNVTYGVPVGLGLWLIGVPNAVLWGLLAIILRFIPYVGPWIAAAFPILVTLAIDPGWTKVAMVLGLFVVMELVSNNIIEVLLYGSSTGISGVALLVAAVFWTWLWGIGGLVLSIPLTVCLLVLGKHVKALRSLDLILASDPALPAPAQFYQRMLSMESEDMLDLATKLDAGGSPEKFYDEVFLPALILAEEDRHRGVLAAERQAFIFQASRDLIEELERREEIAAAKTAKPHGQQPAPANLPARPVIVGVPARDAADEIAALMLGHLLRRRGLPVAIFPLSRDLQEAQACIVRHRIDTVFISGLPPSALNGARQTARRLRALHPDVTLVVGIWSRQNNLAELHERLALPEPCEVVTTLAAALAKLEKLADVKTGARPHLPKDAPVLSPALG